MCLITVCPKGTEKYSETVINALKIAGISNDDGAGFMFKRNSTKKVYISKGYMTTESLLESLYKAKLKKDDELVIHQRIGNKGAKNTDMCHPFVLSDDRDEILMNNKYSSKPVMVHNGTFHSYSVLNSEYSDTFHFVNRTMHNKHLINMLKEDVLFFKTLLSVTLGSNKLCFLFPNEETNLIHIGDFKEHEEGYLFSNESYKDRSIRNVGGVNTTTHSSKIIEDDDLDFVKQFGPHGHRQLAIAHFGGTRKEASFPNNTLKSSSYSNDDLVVNSGVAVENFEGIKFRKILDVWVPEKYSTETQFNSLRFNINPYNFTDFNIVCEKSDDDLKTKKGILYKIISFDKETGIVVINPSYEKSDCEKFVVLDIYKVISDFKTTIINTDIRRKYLGYFNLIREIQSSKNNVKRLAKTLDISNFKVSKNTYYKGVQYYTHTALLYFYHSMMMDLYPDSYEEKINNINVVTLV